MSQSLSSIKAKDLKAEAIRRRINSGSMGLGYWAAVDAIKARKRITKVQDRLGVFEPELFIPVSEAEGLLEKAKASQQAMGVPDNWILRKSC